MGDVIVEEKEAIKRKTLEFFERLYTEQESWRPSANFDGIASITTEESNTLEAAFEEEEMLAAIKSSTPDKAPGPDGYTMAFYQYSWGFIKTDLLAAMQYYHQWLSLAMPHS